MTVTVISRIEVLPEPPTTASSTFCRRLVRPQEFRVSGAPEDGLRIITRK